MLIIVKTIYKIFTIQRNFVETNIVNNETNAIAIKLDTSPFFTMSFIITFAFSYTSALC